MGKLFDVNMTLGAYEQRRTGQTRARRHHQMPILIFNSEFLSCEKILKTGMTILESCN